MPLLILQMCVYTGSISAMKHTTHVKSPLIPAPASPQQSAENTRDDHNSVSESYPGSYMLLIQILEQQQTMLTSSPSKCSKSSKHLRPNGKELSGLNIFPSPEFRRAYSPTLLYKRIISTLKSFLIEPGSFVGDYISYESLERAETCCYSSS